MSYKFSKRESVQIYLKNQFVPKTNSRRAEFFQISKEYQSYLLSKYEETYYPEKILHAGVAIYIERNIEMINKSDVCVFYFEKENLKSRKSGTFLALQYAKRKKKFIINTFE